MTPTRRVERLRSSISAAPQRKDAFFSDSYGGRNWGAR
jgi:hypothetical protein